MILLLKSTYNDVLTETPGEHPSIFIGFKIIYVVRILTTEI